MQPTIRVRRRAKVAAGNLPAQLPKILQQVLARRGLTAAEQLELSLQRLPHFSQLHQVTRAAERLGRALQAGEQICLVGDFDADGATSVALLTHALRALQGPAPDYLIPNRFTDGYGLQPALAEEAARRGAQLLITVDNGISSLSGVERANALGVDVIITDHHLAGSQLPPAYAIVNPNQPACSFPGKALAGVGVAFYLLLALRAWFREHAPTHPGASLKLGQWLDLVAVGTVADVVPLDDLNRILVEQGLKRMRANQCLPGIQALLEVAGREPGKLQAQDLGFAIGPRINAAGRLDDMELGLNCLLADNIQTARMSALRLDQLNQERRSIETGMQSEAERWLAQLELTEQQLPPLLALHQSGWHQGVIGILAGRLKERLHRPVIAFADDGVDYLRGSARSVPGVHIRDLLARVEQQAPGVIARFGGHAMAAGLTVPKSHWEQFQEILHATAREWISPDLLNRTLWSDGVIPPEQLSLAFAHQLQQLGPWGQQFPEPLFDGQFRVLEHRWLKERHLKLTVAPVTAPAQSVTAIAFNVPEAAWEWLGESDVHLVYRLQINEFRQQQSVQLVIQHLSESPPETF